MVLKMNFNITPFSYFYSNNHSPVSLSIEMQVAKGLDFVLSHFKKIHSGLEIYQPNLLEVANLQYPQDWRHYLTLKMQDILTAELAHIILKAKQLILL